MKKIVGVFLTLFVVFSPLAFCSADEMYWDQAPPTSSDITDKDFSIDFNKSQNAKTFGDEEIYDTYKTRDVIPETREEEQPPVRTFRPLQSEPIVRTAPPLRRNISAPVATQKPKRTTPSPASVAPSATPRPAETAPGTSPAPTVSSPGNNSGAPAAGAPAEEKPATKKMKWGQTESKASESENKFHWGKQELKN
ncbi:MAG: hypothetical protein ACP5U1_10825 [Desulfomonilaceae bacterium]